MNPYFWSFFLYAFLILPVSVNVQVLLGNQFQKRIVFRLAGIPIERTNAEGKKAKKRTFRRFEPDLPLLIALVRQGHVRRFMEAFRMDGLSLFLRISWQDAALTAVSYALLRSFLPAVLLCAGRPSGIRGHVEMDFHGQGTELEAECIFLSRMGKLLTAILRLAAAAIRERARRFKAEEENYAAASH